MSVVIFLTIIALFALSAFWSGTETALTSLSVSRIKKLIAMYPRWIVSLRYWLEKPYYILILILIGNTFTNMALSSTMTVFAVRTFQIISREIVEIFTWIITTFLLLIFGDITPKIYSRRNPEIVSVTVLPIYEFLLKTFQPLFSLGEYAAKKFSSNHKIVPFSRMAQFSIDEMRQLFSESNLPGMLGADTSVMVDKVLRLGETDVSKIMTPVDKIEGVCMDRKDENLLDKLVETSRSRIPTIKRNPYRVTGYVHIKDILKQLSVGKEDIDDDIVRVAYIIPHDKKVGQLLKEFQTGNFHISFVSDEFGNILGVVTLEDILEELVGEILDEYDVA
ncbi:MAG: Magnesium and cobalt efflux protein CorC [Syntrophomonadaceae bacterium]|nr:Magnesium and cobalt efflux protein CorC [Bacillota bacterium]